MALVRSGNPGRAYRRPVRLALALVLGRFAGRITRLFGRGGSAVPGLVAERIYRHTIERLVASIEGGVVLVTGTNGKTTTTKLLVSALEADGRTVITNPSGSNLERGIASALVAGASVRGRVSADIAAFEVDEAAIRRLAPRVKPRLVVVTNLARDQLDRFGELDTTAGHLTAALGHAAATLLNADDPKVRGLAGGITTYFGAAPEIRALMPADDELHGSAEASAHGRVLSVCVAEVTTGATGQTVRLDTGADSHSVSLQVPGVYNAYNAAAAFAAALHLGVEASVALGAFAAMTPPFGRGQVISHKGRRFVVVLVKNPAGFNQAIRLLRQLTEPTSVVIAINDNIADGRDVSWLWDVRVEELADTPHRFGTSGIRATDMALRLKYAGVAGWAETDLHQAVERLIADSATGDTVYVVPTYTAMLTLLEILLPGVPRHEVWT